MKWQLWLISDCIPCMVGLISHSYTNPDLTLKQSIFLFDTVYFYISQWKQLLSWNSTVFLNPLNFKSFANEEITKASLVSSSMSVWFISSPSWLTSCVILFFFWLIWNNHQIWSHALVLDFQWKWRLALVTGAAFSEGVAFRTWSQCLGEEWLFTRQTTAPSSGVKRLPLKI